MRKFESKDEIMAIAPQLRLVYNKAFEGSEGFSPITEEEIIVIARRMLSVADPRLIKLVYKDDQIIGFLVVLTTFGVANNHVGNTKLLEHGGRDFTGVGATLVNRDILRTQLDFQVVGVNYRLD